MTNQQILEKAMQKAIDGGWLPYFSSFDKEMAKDTLRFTTQEGASDVRFLVETKGRYYGLGGYSLTIPEIIFNHDFAKALWGIGCSDCGNPDAMTNPMGCGQPEWCVQLQQMVIADDPIKYLGENL